MKRTMPILLLIAFLLGGCQDRIEPGTAKVKRPLVSGVGTTEVAPATVEEYYETSATVKAKTTSTVAGRMMGTVTAILVKEGDRVSAGQLLLTLDDRDVRQKVLAAQAALREADKAMAAARENKALAEITSQRYKNLYKEKALSRQELDQIETRRKTAALEYGRTREMVKRAKSGLAEARVYEDFTRINSPISGIVTQKHIELGNMARPGAPLFTIEDPSSFRLETKVDETLAGRLKPGTPVKIDIPSLGQRPEGVITEVVPAVDPGARTFLVKIGLAGNGLQSGLYAKVKIPLGEKKVILLPLAVIVSKGQLTGVYVVDSHNVITYRLIRFGKHYGQGVEILSGLDPGERVITSGLDRAVDGGLLQEDKRR